MIISSLKLEWEIVCEDEDCVLIAFRIEHVCEWRFMIVGLD